MLINIMVFCLILQGSIYADADQTSSNIVQEPQEAVISRGESITFYCIIPKSWVNAWVTVLWSKQGDNEYLRTLAASRKRFGANDNGTWYFELYNAVTQDSGVYLCTMTRRKSAPINGTGSLLIVHGSSYGAVGGTVSGLAILVLMIIIGLCYWRQNNKGKETCTTEVRPHDELGIESATVHYAEVDFGRPRNTPRPRDEDERVTYGQVKARNRSESEMIVQEIRD